MVWAAHGGAAFGGGARAGRSQDRIHRGRVGGQCGSGLGSGLMRSRVKGCEF